MKISLLPCLLAGLLALPFSLEGQTSQEPPLGTCPTEWPGVHFDLTRIVRIDPTHILVAVIVRGDATTKNPTQIFGLSRATPEHPDDVDPFSLTTATLVDQATQQKYKADAHLPETPYWGGPDIISNIHPNTWFQLAVRFEVPPPLPPASDGKQPVQKVSFYLPKAKTPIKDVVLPSLEPR